MTFQCLTHGQTQLNIALVFFNFFHAESGAAGCVYTRPFASPVKKISFAEKKKCNNFEFKWMENEKNRGKKAENAQKNAQKCAKMRFFAKMEKSAKNAQKCAAHFPPPW